MVNKLSIASEPGETVSAHPNLLFERLYSQNSRKTDMEDISEFGLCQHPAQVVQSTTEPLLAVEPELIDDLRQFSSNLFPRKEKNYV